MHWKIDTIFRWINTPGPEAQNKPLSLSDFDEINDVNTLTLSAENVNKIGLVISEIWPDKVKSRRRIYSAKYGTCTAVLNFIRSDLISHDQFDGYYNSIMISTQLAYLSIL